VVNGIKKEKTEMRMIPWMDLKTIFLL